MSAGALAQMCLESAEYKSEMGSKGGKGVLWKEFGDFMAGDGRDLKARVDRLESKLEDLDKSR